jgi:hypothetical protein
MYSSKARTHFHELLTHKVSDVIDIGWKWVAAFSRSVFWRRLVSTTYRFIQYIPRGVLAGQTKVDEIINRRALSPSISLCSALEIPIPINFDRMESLRIHPRGVEHDVVSRAITAKPFRFETLST